MDDIRRVLRLASWRLYALDLLRTLAVMLTVGLTGILIARLVEKLFGYNTLIEPLWPRIFAYTGGGVLAIALLWSFLRRHKVLAVARELDERAELKESLSTALCF